MKASSLRDAIVLLFESEPEKRFTLKEVYDGIEDLYDLSESERELHPRYPQPRYYHEVRSIIAEMEKARFIEKLDRDQRRLKHKAKGQ